MSDRTLEELENEYEKIKKEIHKLMQEKSAAYDEMAKIKAQYERFSDNKYGYAEYTLKEITIKRLEDREAYDRYKQLRRRVGVRIPQDIDALIVDLNNA